MNLSKSDYSIVRYNSEDISGILDLLNRVFSKQQHFALNRDKEWWDWKYNQNIFGKAIIIVAKKQPGRNHRLKGLMAMGIDLQGKNN